MGEVAVSMRIVVTDYLEPDFNWEQDQLRSRGLAFSWQQHQLKFAGETELVAAVREADILVVNMAKMTASVIGQLARARLIIRHGIGYDNVDGTAAAAAGIRLANVPDYCPDEVAEQAMMLIFAAARRLREQLVSMEASVAKGSWDFAPVGPVYMMKGKTLGIIGCGRIGSRVLKMSAALGMRILVCDPYLSDDRKSALGIQTVNFEHVLHESDIVTLHAPLHDETRGLICRRTLAMMKPTAVLINTARGGLIVDEDLARALHDRVIAGAALDVYQREPPSRDNPLFGAPGVLMTPHLSWYSEESGWSIREKILEDIVLCLENKPPRFTVNPEVEKTLGGKAYRF